jgi:uncharacterized membrane protein required for colicin V production
MNLVFILFLVLFIVKIAQGFKRGLVKEIIALITLLVLCVIAGLIGYGLRSYVQENYLGLVITVVLFVAVFIAHHLLGLVLFPLKLFSRLPVIHTLDRLLGVVFGIVETVLLIWLVYTLTMEGYLGVNGTLIVEQTAENPILTWIYEHNYLAMIVEKFSQIIPQVS